MALPLIWIDTNGGYSLAKLGTRRDFAVLGMQPHEGMQCIFYSPDEGDAGPGFLHGVGTVMRDTDGGLYADIPQLTFSRASSIAEISVLYE